MPRVVQFSSLHGNSFQVALQTVEQYLVEAELPRAQISTLLAQVQPAIEPLFKPRLFDLVLDDGLALDENQAQAVIDANARAFERVEQAYNEDLGNAACVIAGLLVRCQMAER